MRVVREVVNGTESSAEIAEKYRISERAVNRWKHQSLFKKRVKKHLEIYDTVLRKQTRENAREAVRETWL
ncbi:MAG: hypothetical protein J5U19_14630 [Candidatus Methanoperedens sp.]|nr:hypothetical protein [Candidatus Methanoperedens sp.]